MFENNEQAQGSLNAMKKILLFLIALSLAISVAVYLFIDAFYSDESKRHKMTSIAFNAHDPDGHLIGFANAVFRDHLIFSL